MQQKRKILITTDSIKRGGKERQIFIIASELLSRGYDIHIISLNRNSFNYIDEYFFPLERIIFLRGNKFGKIIYLFRIISSNTNSILLTFDTISAFICLISYKLFNIIFINCTIRHGIRLKKFSHYFRSFVAKLSPYVIANSYAGLRANKLKPDSRRFVLYNGNPLVGKFSTREEEKRTLRKDILGDMIKGDEILFISIANFVPYKDNYTVFKALSRLKGEKNFFYLIIGDGVMRPQIENSIIEFGLVNHVMLIGATKEVFKYLSISDVFIHSSRGEGISNAILEALIAGLPVIATDAGGTSEILKPEFSRLFKYQDDESLYNILRNDLSILLENTRDKSIFDAVLEKFKVETMVNKLMNILEKVS